MIAFTSRGAILESTSESVSDSVIEAVLLQVVDALGHLEGGFTTCPTENPRIPGQIHSSLYHHLLHQDRWDLRGAVQ